MMVNDDAQHERSPSALFTFSSRLALGADVTEAVPFFAGRLQ